ncbi:MAG: polyamine ABC transporter substrate-binding protein [Deltaproteobacteria bacterium]|nr:polyamine ABC transporter substrate-binding protein [Deltaproteobacteria bacterium]
MKLILFLFNLLFCILWALTFPALLEAKDPNASSVLRLALDAANPGILDPHFAAATHDRSVVDMLFNGLVRYKPGNSSSIEPDLAESFPMSEIKDGRQIWTFNLRKGVMFHPGPKTGTYELTADDVVYSLQKSADPNRSAYAGEYTGMTFEKSDKYTIRIILEKPLSTTLFLPKVANYAGGFIVSKKAVEAMGDDFFKAHPVGTGPFMFGGYTSGKKIRINTNKLYFRGRPFLDAVEILFMPDIGHRELALKTAEVDCITGKIDTAWARKMEQETGILVDIHGVGEVATIYFNTKVQPFADVRVRKAIAYALERDLFLSYFGKSMVKNVYSPVPVHFLPGGLTKEEVETLGLDYAFNLEKARQLLTEAGYFNGFALKVVASEFDQYLKNYECMRDQLVKINIDLKLEVVDHSTMHKKIRQGLNPITLYAAWRPNADVYLTRFFHSDSIVVTGAKPDTNFSNYDKIDGLIEAARLEINPHKQIELWKHAQIKILEDMVAYPLHYMNLIYARRAYVDYGHELVSSMALYPQITEKTRFLKKTVNEMKMQKD